MAVKIGGCRGIMCRYISFCIMYVVIFVDFSALMTCGCSSYNEVNGEPACMSPFLRDILRTNWSFNGMVTSDTDAISPANNHHNYTFTPQQAVRAGLQDGRCDVESSVHSTNFYATYIPQLVKSGQLDIAVVDQAIRDTFRVRFEAGDDTWVS